MNRIILILSLVFIQFGTCWSQVKFSEGEIMFQSRHTWRGTEFGTAPAVEPSVTVFSGKFSFNVWASKTFDDSFSELDLIPSVQFDDFSISVFDYYNPVRNEKNQYMNFKEGESRHSLELSVDNYSGEKSRLKFMIATFLAGDKDEDTGNPNFSTYIEVKYPFKISTIDAEPFAGLTPFKGLYADQFAFVNTGLSISKAIKVSEKFTIPMVLTYTFNPYENNQFLTFGLGISFSSEN
jgi:hypothetical protein